MFLCVQVKSFITIMEELLHNALITATVSMKFCAEIFATSIQSLM
jgi:hypothetical protein